MWSQIQITAPGSARGREPGASSPSGTAIPSAPVQSGAPNGPLFRWRGTASLAKRVDDRAIADFTEAIRLDPKDPCAYSRRASATRNKRDHEQELADRAMAVQLDTNDADYRVSLANFYSARVLHDKAIAGYEDAIRIAPNNQ